MLARCVCPATNAPTLAVIGIFDVAVLADVALPTFPPAVVATLQGRAAQGIAPERVRVGILKALRLDDMAASWNLALDGFSADNLFRVLRQPAFCP